MAYFACSLGFSFLIDRHSGSCRLAGKGDERSSFSLRGETRTQGRPGEGGLIREKEEWKVKPVVEAGQDLGWHEISNMILRPHVYTCS